MSFFFSVLSFFFKLREREREREKERERERYIKLGIRRNSPKVTYLIFRRGSTGEYFFFYGLIDFRLFLKLAWRKWLLRVSQILFCLLHPEYLAFGSASYEPCPTTNFFLFFFRWREGVPTSFLSPSQSFGFYLPPPWSGDFVRGTRCHPSQVTEYRQVNPIYHHALTVILWGLATVNSNERIAVITLPSSQWDITWHPPLREERDKRNNIKKVIHFTVLSPFLFLPFFHFIFLLFPFLLHALTNSFLLLFSSFLIFNIEEDNSFSLSFSLSPFLFL